MVRLGPIGPGELSRVAHLRVAPEQEKFSGRVEEAFEAAEEGVDFHAVYEAGRVVGFFKVDRRYPARLPFARPGELGLRAFLIDLGEQGRGIASQAVALLPDYLGARYPEAPAVVLTVNCVNAAAIAAYLKGGFIDTGEIWPKGEVGPQHIMRMML